MSHMNVYRSALFNLDAVAEACRRLGLTFVPNQTQARFYREQQEPCDHAILIPNSRYEVGLRRQEDGSYALVMDEYDQKLKSLMGEQGQRFLQHYGIAAAILQYQQTPGIQYLGETLLENGTIQLQFARH
jgi:hypothetical protein